MNNKNQLDLVLEMIYIYLLENIRKYILDPLDIVVLIYGTRESPSLNEFNRKYLNMYFKLD